MGIATVIEMRFMGMSTVISFSIGSTHVFYLLPIRFVDLCGISYPGDARYNMVYDH